MNIAIKDFLNTNTDYNIPNLLMGHQVATIDYLFKSVIKENKSVLLYHTMGSGKTILCLVFALLNSIKKKIIIVVPNNTMIYMWTTQLEKAISMLPNILYNTNNIQIKTRVKFIDEINSFTSSLINKIKIYEDHLIFIDEAHNFFGNNSGYNLIKIKNNIQSNFILITGSPISNTVEPLRDVLYILKNNTAFDNKYIKKGKRVFETSLTKEGKKYITEELKDYITYYDQENTNIPSYSFFGTKVISYPVVMCQMTDEQSRNYDKMTKLIPDNNDIFSKILLNESFFSFGDIDYYNNFDRLIGQNKELYPGLNISGNYLVGKELTDLKLSSKFRYFVDNYILEMKRTKKFSYFRNSKIGSLVIRSVMRANGVSEYDREIVNNFRCTKCNLKRECMKKLNKNCTPAKFAIITANELNNNSNIINIILDKYNEPQNDDGDYLMFLFGSKIISESYTLKEVKDIILLTVPDTKSELLQIISRALRSFSYKDIINTEILIKILISIKKDTNVYNIIKTDNKKIKWNINDIDFNISDIDKYGDFIKNTDIEYDIKKLFYLEVKSYNSEELLEIFKKLHCDYYSEPCDEIKPLIFYEKIKRIFYDTFTLDNIRNLFVIKMKGEYKSILDNQSLDKFILELKNKGLYVYNSKFKNSLLLHSNTIESETEVVKYCKYKEKKNNVENNFFHLIPLRLISPSYMMEININALMNNK